MDSITISQKELEEVLGEVANNLAEETAKDDFFFKFTLQTLFLKFSRDIIFKLF